MLRDGGDLFRILVVDDDPAAARLLQEVMKQLPRRHQLHFAKDGLEALEFLRRSGAYSDAPCPNLILLDLNMPRLSGLDTLSAIKNDPELCVIPVIVLSTAASPHEVRKCYEAHANCYVQKPLDLDRSVKLAQAVEAFWMDFALLPYGSGLTAQNLQTTDYKGENSSGGPREPSPADSGPPIATESSEARSAHKEDSPTKAKKAPQFRVSDCEEYNRLLVDFSVAVHEMVQLHEQQFLAIIEGDSDSHRFDLLIHMANERKQLAKYDFLRHVEEHSCSNTK